MPPKSHAPTRSCAKEIVTPVKSFKKVSASRGCLDLAPEVLVHSSHGSLCCAPTTSLALLRTRRKFQGAAAAVLVKMFGDIYVCKSSAGSLRHAPTTSSALSFISQEKRSGFSRYAPTRSSALILRLQKSRDFLA